MNASTSSRQSGLFFLTFVITVLFSSVSFAAQGLVIHVSEFGVGKFHRADNKVHTYPEASSWTPYILPADTPTQQPFVQRNQDGSYTVFFSTLEELVKSVVEIAQSEKQKVSVLNLHGHGLPGRMWFPKDTRTMNGWQCMSWKEAASGSDQANYRQYYSPLSVSQVQQIRDMSNNPNVTLGCTTGLPEWQEAVEKTPEFKQAFASDAQIHFLSCVVGLGSVGEAFTKGMAALLLSGGTGRVETAVNFGLGDWSMAAGMGFWDYINDEQLKRDGALYSANKTDSEIAQKGTIRIAHYAGEWTTSLRTNIDFMVLGHQKDLQGTPVPEELVRRWQESLSTSNPLPNRIRVPGTNACVEVETQ